MEHKKGLEPIVDLIWTVEEEVKPLSIELIDICGDPLGADCDAVGCGSTACCFNLRGFNCC